MLTRVCLSLVLLAAMPGWSQALPTATGGPDIADDDTRMQTPPPVSGEAYPTTVGSEARSNYLSGGLNFSTAYSDNVLGAGNTTPVSDVTYTVFPSIALDQATPRQHRKLTYSPGFTFYQRTTTLNEMDQNAAASFQYRLSEHTSINLTDAFQKSSNVFNQPYPLSGEPIAGSAQSAPVGVVAPFADRISNSANVEFSYQFSRSGMIGISGIDSELNYPNAAQVPGLANSNSRGGSAFYNRRLSSTQYAGVSYQYFSSRANPQNSESAQSDVQTHTISPFYTIYLSPTISLSVSGGPQYFDATQPPLPSSSSWTYSGTGSVGWQGSHTNLVAKYSRSVSQSVGLVGAFSSNSADASSQWQITRNWSAGVAASYFINKNVTPLLSLANPGGHSVSGTVTLQHSMGEHVIAVLGYARLHQSYGGIAVISNAPDSDRGFVSVSYQFRRPLGH